MSRKSARVPDTKIDEMYTAGQKAPAGIYRLVGSTREISLDREDVLPASLDGKVAVYVRQSRTWAQIRLSKGEKKPSTHVS